MSPSHLCMSFHNLFRAASAVVLLTVAVPASADQDDPAVPLVARAGRALRIALDRRVSVKQPGQQVSGRLIEPMYVYDRIVLPLGTRAIGHVETIQHASRGARVRAVLGGDLTPPRRAVIQFDTLVLDDGRSISVHTSATEGVEDVVLRVAAEPARTGRRSKAREEIARQAKEAASVVTAPHKAERAKVALIRALPYHPLLLAKGTVYAARLTSPIEFGTAVPAPRAPDDAAPAPESILRAQLLTAITSETSAPGAPIEAVLTQPVVAADGSVILAEGTMLTGEVTVSKPARRFHRAGQLRVLFETITASDRQPVPLPASLYAVQSGRRDGVRLDEEGGVKSASSNLRFAAPALATLALVGATHGRVDYDTDGLGPETQYGGALSGSLGGVMGLGLFGVGLSSLGRYVTVATAAVGVAQTVYSTVFAKGRNVAFPRDMSILIQLAPGQSARKNTEEPRR